MAYGGAAAAYAAMVQAVEASGAIIRMEPDAFNIVVSKADRPLVVIAPGGWPSKGYQYLTSYKGLIFYTRSKNQIQLPGGAEVISAKQIWIPS
jgi:hypothetical protein